jgi:hypothetical protein
MMMVASIASLPIESKIFYDRTTLDVGLDLLAFINACTKKRLPANIGKTIEFRRFESLGRLLNTVTTSFTPISLKTSVLIMWLRRRHAVSLKTVRKCWTR